MASIFDVFGRLLLDDSRFQADAAKAGQKGGTTAGGQASAAVGKAFTAAGAIGGSLFTGAIGGAVAFEEQLATVNTVAKLPKDTLASLGDEVLQLSKDTGKGTDELLAGLYDLVSAGVPAEQAIGVLRDSAIFATGALGTTGEAVDVVTSALNAYGLEANQSTRVTDIFAQAVADGKITAAELGDSIAQIAPIASSAGISIEEVSAGFAALTAKGVPATAAATQMRASISALLTPNEALNRIQAQTGINFAELAREQGLAVALDKLREVTKDTGGEFEKFAEQVTNITPEMIADGWDVEGIMGEFRDNLGLTKDEAQKFVDLVGREGMGEALAWLQREVGATDQGFAGALGSVEAYQFALASTGDNATGFAEQLDRVAVASEEGGVAASQYAELQGTAAAQGRKWLANLKALGIQIGGPFVDSLGPAVSALGGMGHGLSGIFNLSRLVGGGIGALAGKFLPQLTMTLLNLIPGVAIPAGGLGTAIGGFISTAMGIAVAAWPLLLLAAIVAAVVFLVNNPEIVAKIAEFVGGMLEAIAHFLEGLPELFFHALDMALAAFGQFIANLPAILGQLIPAVVDLLGKVVGIFLLLPTKIGEILAGLIVRAAGFFLSLPGRIAPLVGGIMGHVGNLAGQVVGAVSRLVGQVVQFFLSIPGRILAFGVQIGQQIRDMASRGLTAVSSFVGSIVRFFLSIPGKVAAVGGRIVGGIINGMASLPGKLADVIRRAFANLRIDIGPFHISGSGVTIDLPKIDLPHFAAGGRPVPGQVSLIGEEGPELWVPDSPGTILPAGSFKSMTLPEHTEGGNTTFQLSTYGLPLRATTPVEVVHQLRRAARVGGITPPRKTPAWSSGR